MRLDTIRTYGLLLVCTLMLLKGVQASEGLSTLCNITLVRPFIRVSTPVHLQGIASFKSLSTKIALITLFACAGTVVDLKAFLQRKGLPKPRNNGRLDGASNIRP